MPKKFDLTNKRFGMLTVIAPAPNMGSGTTWSCRCDCGKVSVKRTRNLMVGDTRSCGCLMSIAHRTHGHSLMPGRTSLTYKTWGGMVHRCKDKKNPDYGARGITVCKRWEKFENFLADMGERPSRQHSIERLDNKKGYAPENCKWATDKEQNWNKSNVILVEMLGKTVPLKEAARVANVNYNRLHFWFRTKKVDIATALERAAKCGRWV